MSLYRGPLVAGTGASYETLFGISNTYSGVIIQSEDLSVTDITHIVHDQFGRVANELSYDQDKRNNFSFIASALPAELASVGSTFEYAGITWKIDGLTENGTFDGLKRWSVQAHSYYNYPENAKAIWDDSTLPGPK